jgi:RNA polymerase sigma-70 factor (ECF subfamily)
MISSIEPLPTDEAAFTALAEQHRRELHLHCYRMLASVQDAEDAVQETFLRAWRSRETFAGRSTFRAWLYRIATNAAPGHHRPAAVRPLGHRRRQPRLRGAVAGAVSGEPARGRRGGGAGGRRRVPGDDRAGVHRRGAAVPPQGRAALLLRDVLGWSAADSATLLDVSVAALNSSLQRARAVLQEHLPPDRAAWSAEYEGQERELVERYVDAHEHHDEEKLLALLAENARWAMPPDPVSITGRARMYAAWREGGFGTAEFGELRCVVTRANGQPAVGVYRRREGEEDYRPLAIDVLRMADGVVAEILTFVPGQFAALGLRGPVLIQVARCAGPPERLLADQCRCRARPGGVLLIDPGVRGDEMTCLANDLRELGQPVVAGFSTHPHWDHLLWHASLGTAPRYGTARCAATVRERLSDAGAKARVAGMIPPDIVEQVPLDLLGLITGLPAGTEQIPWDGPQVRIIEHQAHARAMRRW